MIVPLGTAAAIAEVQPGTIRQWAHRGHIADHEGGYDTLEILLWLDQRSLAALCARAGYPRPAEAAAVLPPGMVPRRAGEGVT
jgi:hypothetical protein